VQSIISAARKFRISAGFPPDLRIIYAEFPRRGNFKFPPYFRRICAVFPRRGNFKFPQVIPKRK
jgi:hypothetical protein